MHETEWTMPTDTPSITEEKPVVKFQPPETQDNQSFISQLSGSQADIRSALSVNRTQQKATDSQTPKIEEEMTYMGKKWHMVNQTRIK